MNLLNEACVVGLKESHSSVLCTSQVHSRVVSVSEFRVIFNFIMKQRSECSYAPNCWWH